MAQPLDRAEADYSIHEYALPFDEDLAKIVCGLVYRLERVYAAPC